MKADEIKLNDWGRIFAGQVPAEFYMELVIRAAFIYLLLAVCMRLLGKRMSGHVSNLELVSLVALASAIGVPMLAVDRGLLPALIIAVIVVGFTRVISLAGYHYRGFARATQDKVDILVENSVMHYDVLRRVRITRERLFSHLRSMNIHHLGMVKRLYMEGDGTFSLIKEAEPRPGLLVLPDWDKEFLERKVVVAANTTICKNCGCPMPEGLERVKANGKCLNCKHEEWTNAVKAA